MPSNALWMEKAFKNAGKPGHSLHRATGTSAGEKIPARKVYRAAHSEDPHTRKMANLAKTAASIKRKHYGS